ncbi:alpha/beta hydrolase [Betaproteobacteria bacterium]|nr:alpha/beta hydrolase [Betaproteobacteria bacterium]
MAYVEWGDPANPQVLICVHGLTRNARDFDALAQVLAADYRVVCPDVTGRGRSDWLEVKSDYDFPLYISDMITLLARLGVEQVDWVGTSMGGIIGMLIASQPRNPIRHLVLNDIGPLITAASLRRIGEYVGCAPLFRNLDEVEQYVRCINAPFGRLTDAQWRHLARYSVRQTGDGLVSCYDPALSEPLSKAPITVDTDLWSVYDQIKCPTLAIHGVESDLLLPAVWQEMATRGPKAALVEFPDAGHAPALMEARQIAAIRDFLVGA